MRPATVLVILACWAWADPAVPPAPGGDPGTDGIVEAVRVALDRVELEAAAAYSDLLDADPALAGTVELTLTVGPDGLLTIAGMTCDPGLEPLAGRLGLLLDTLTVAFPAPLAQSVTVILPLSFAPAR